MSKKIRILIGAISLLLVGGGAFFILKPKTKSSFEAKEIKIKQAEIPTIDNLIYRDSAGFSFEYPSLLTVDEVETEDSSIYSSLELSDIKGVKMKLKIDDSALENTDAWEKDFENINSVIKSSHLLWVDIPAIQVIYGIPKTLLTVAVEDGVKYSLESQFDDGGFLNQAHETILSSFKFDQSVMIEEPVDDQNSEASESADVVLIEEKLE